MIVGGTNQGGILLPAAAPWAAWPWDAVDVAASADVTFAVQAGTWDDDSPVLTGKCDSPPCLVETDNADNPVSGRYMRCPAVVRRGVAADELYAMLLTCDYASPYTMRYCLWSSDDAGETWAAVLGGKYLSGGEPTNIALMAADFPDAEGASPTSVVAHCLLRNPRPNLVGGKQFLGVFVVTYGAPVSGSRFVFGVSDDLFSWTFDGIPTVTADGLPSLTYDEDAGLFRMFTRKCSYDGVPSVRVRAVTERHSADFVTWTTTTDAVVLHGPLPVPEVPEAYALSATRLGSRWAGVAVMYYPDPGEGTTNNYLTDNWGAVGWLDKLNLELAVSSDGISWTLPYTVSPFTGGKLAVPGGGGWRDGSIVYGSGFYEDSAGNWCLMVGGAETDHHTYTSPPDIRTIRTGRLTWPAYRVVAASLTAAETPGSITLVTRSAFKRRLMLNYDPGATGTATIQVTTTGDVELAAAADTVLTDSGDGKDFRVDWSPRFVFPNASVKIIVNITGDATVYSLRTE